MMNGNEILAELEKLDIISNIAGSYFITEKYKELLAGSPSTAAKLDVDFVPPKLDVESILDPSTNGKDWGIEITESAGRARATALLDVCQVPAMATPEDRDPYRLRGLDKDSVNVIGNIVDNQDIDPATFIEAIRFYYKHTKMPKGFKKLVLDGDVFDIYQEHISGELAKNLKSNGAKGNQTWK